MKSRFCMLSVLIIVAFINACTTTTSIPKPAGKPILLFYSDVSPSDAAFIFTHFDFYFNTGKKYFSVKPATRFALRKDFKAGYYTINKLGLYNETSYGYAYMRDVDINFELKENTITIFPVKFIVESLGGKETLIAYISSFALDDFEKCMEYLKSSKNINGWDIIFGTLKKSK